MLDGAHGPSRWSIPTGPYSAVSIRAMVTVVSDDRAGVSRTPHTPPPRA
jgi:hypothetical protein